MKKSIIAFNFLFLFLTISQAQYDAIVILEKSFAVKELQKYFEKDEAGMMLPFKVVTNDHFSELLELDFRGDRLSLFNSEEESDLKEDEAYVDVRKFKIRNGNVSILKFRYAGRKFKIKFRNIDNEWVYQSMLVRGKGDFYQHVDLEY